MISNNFFVQATLCGRVDNDIFSQDLEVVVVEDEDALLHGDLGSGEGDEQEGEGGRQQHGLQSWLKL